MELPNRLHPHVAGALGLWLATLVLGCQSRPDGDGARASMKNAPRQASASAAAKKGWFASRTVTLDDGTTVGKTIINGPPRRPAGLGADSAPVALPKPALAGGINTLTVPAYDWSFGCSATAAAMIAAYYDRNGFDNLYVGPTEGGIMPLDSSVWPKWTDGVGDVYDQDPLAASHAGLDGRATKGSIDDYWVSYLSS
jgi:hypothetical protein